MNNLSKVVAAIGVLVALATLVTNPENSEAIVAIFGENAATKIAAVGAFVAGLGGSILEFFKTKPTNVTPNQ